MRTKMNNLEVERCPSCGAGNQAPFPLTCRLCGARLNRAVQMQLRLTLAATREAPTPEKLRLVR